ncbi:MAG: putative baseplate assembly protein [Acidobacteriia bacterium]|nr:putative baseplate assembly protein [Terriglobia bacterium]
MPLPTPILDDRSYQQLRDELIRRIPVYAPEWTDHNASDPGITLIELFAFLGENLLYRFNQIPEATKLAFLKYLQIPLRPATAARAMVTIKTSGTSSSVLVPIATEMRAGSVPFESLTEVSAWPLEITAMGKIVAAKPTSPDSLEFTEAAIAARGGLKAKEQAAYYTNATVPGDPTAATAAPVDFSVASTSVDYSKSVDGAIWIAVRKTKDTDIGALDKGLLSLGFVPDPVVPTIEEIDACPGAGRSSSSGSEMIWQASTSTLEANGLPAYTSITVERDTTRGLETQGTVQLRLPDNVETALGVVALSDVDRGGTDTFPPQIEDDDVAKSVIFWLRATRRDPSRPLGKILFIGINATEVVQMITAPPEFVGTGTAGASQVYKLVHTPVINGTTSIQVEEPQGWTDWQAVDGFEESTEDSRHYVLDPEAGTITFGNGVRGRAPQIGERIRAVEYRYGGGADGNVGAKAITKIVGVSSVAASNPLPAVGGAPGETVAEGLERVPGEFRRHDRAVTQSDFEELALATPGAGVGRADCLPLFDPRTKNPDAAGVVSVVVWPREDLAHPNAPVPDRALLSQVCECLDARRLITTELYVIPPTYRRIAVAVGLQAKPGYGIEAVRRWAELVVRQYLSPLPPYGPSGDGWPLGTDVYGPELEAAVLQVEGVQFIECLRLAVWDETKKAWVEAMAEATTDGSNCPPREKIPMKAWEVPEVAEITVVQGDAMTPGEALGPVTPPLVPVPIPTIKSEC